MNAFSSSAFFFADVLRKELSIPVFTVIKNGMEPPQRLGFLPSEMRQKFVRA